MTSDIFPANLAKYREACAAVADHPKTDFPALADVNEMRARFHILAHAGRRHGWPEGMTEDRLRGMAPESHRDGLLPKKETTDGKQESK